MHSSTILTNRGNCLNANGWIKLHVNISMVIYRGEWVGSQLPSQNCPIHYMVSHICRHTVSVDFICVC